MGQSTIIDNENELLQERAVGRLFGESERPKERSDFAVPT
jgi:hypothetical protein